MLTRTLNLAELVRIFSNFPIEFAGGGEASTVNIARSLGVNHYSVEYVSDSGYQGVTRISTQEVISSLVRDFTYSRQRFERYRSLLPPQLYRSLPTESQLATSDVNLLLIDRIPPVQFLLMLRSIEVPTILLLQGFSVESKLPPNPLSAAYILYLRFASRTLGLLSKARNVYFQVLTPPQREVLFRSGIAPSHVFTIPSGVDLSRIPEPSDHKSFGVLFAGRIERVTKGIDFLVRVLKGIESAAPPALRVNIIGSGRDQGLLDLFAKSEVVRYHGFVSQDEKEKILRQSDVSLSTSYLEPFSLSTVEALASGAMVLTTPCNGPRSIVGLSPLLGKVLPYDPGLFVAEVFEVYRRWNVSNDRLLAERFSRSSFVRTRYSTQRMEKDYADMVKQIRRRGLA
jgi:glycosyltransferase involved in cell wall biosynthesis